MEYLVPKVVMQLESLNIRHLIYQRNQCYLNIRQLVPTDIQMNQLCIPLKQNSKIQIFVCKVDNEYE